MANKETEEQKAQREIVEGIASNIESLAKTVKSLLGGRLKTETIVILLANSTKLPKYQIEAVLDALINMDRDHLKK